MFPDDSLQEQPSKAPSRISLTVSGISTVLSARPSLCAKANFPILSVPGKIVRDERPSRLLNAKSSIFRIFAGMIRLSKAHLENEPSPTVVTPGSANALFTSSAESDVHPSNPLTVVKASFEGHSMLASEVQSEKASFSIVARLFGKLISVRAFL